MSRDSRILLGVSAGILAVVCLGYALLPVIGIHLGISSYGSLDWGSAIQSPRIRELLVTSSWIAVSSGVLASLLGCLLALTLKRVGHVAKLLFAGAILLLHLVSPYLLTQAAIHLFGNAGVFWAWLDAEPMFSLFSIAGVVGILSLWLMPLAMLIQLMSRGLPTGYHEELVALKVSWWRRCRLYWWPSYAKSFLLSIGICGLIAFWNYDVASMLRVNVFPIELMASFGSFYDYEMAVGLAGIPVLVSLLVIALLVWFSARQQWTSQLADRRILSGANFAGKIVSIALGGFVLGVFFLLVGGLWSQVGGLDAFTTFLSEYRVELENTLRYGFVSSGIVVVLTLLLVACGRLGRGRGWQPPVIAMLGCWLLPPVLLAMGWVSLWDISIFRWARELGLEMYLIGIHSVLVLIPVLAAVASAIWSPSHNEVLNSTDCRLSVRCLLLGNRLRGLFALLGIAGFALVAREVAAGLLNMPPGGSTLAISIETLLHFEQPDRVAALCLAYLIAVLGVSIVVGLIGYSLDSTVKTLLARRLKV